MLRISLLFFPFSHTSLLYNIGILIASLELSLVIDALLDHMDGVFKEPNPMLEMGSLLPDHLVCRILFQLLVADV